MSPASTLTAMPVPSSHTQMLTSAVLASAWAQRAQHHGELGERVEEALAHRLCRPFRLSARLTRHLLGLHLALGLRGRVRGGRGLGTLRQCLLGGP